ncbi:MAG TPA: SdrD B-like domain-containing protein, partial [Sphingomicrobium sp.]
MAEVFVGPDITGDGVADADITPSGSFVNIGGVLFTDAANTGSGTGNYNTFLAISNNSGIEQGFNSDDTPPIDASNKDIDQAKTHTVKLSDLVVVTVNGVQYYEFRVDLNEANSDPNAQISLDQFKLYSSANGGINDTTTLFSQNLIYDMDAGGNKSVLLSDAESSGSGNDDYSVLVPITAFAGLNPTETYVYLFTQMGAAGTAWRGTATFEEWNLQNGVTLTGTKFEDANNNGIKDVGEGPIAGVTIFIDANKNGIFDAGERSTLTDANGNYTFHGVATGQEVWIDEVVPDGATQTTGTHEVVTISSTATPGSTVVVDPIGNFVPSPEISITKSASVPGDCADTVGELITYTIVLDNTGNVALDTVVLTDAFEGGSEVTLTVTGDTNLNGTLDVGEVWRSGDTGNDGVMGVNETWTYTYVRAVTQEQIDSDGGGDGTLDDVATANAEQVNSNVAADEVSDDATVDVCQDPALGIEKSATVDGDCADTVGEKVNYTILVSNEGNVGLETVVVTDDFADVGSLDNDAHDDGVIDGDTDNDGILDVGETWTYTAFHTVTQDDIDNNGNYDSDADGINDVLRNVATANADAVTSGEAAQEVTDDATVDVCQDPALGIEKSATVDGDCADTVGEKVNYTILVSNEGNVGLENVVVTDDFADVGSLDNDADD